MLIFILSLTAIEFICVFFLISTTYRNSNIQKSHEDHLRAIKNISTQLNNNREKVNNFMLNIQTDEKIMENLAEIVSGEKTSNALVYKTIQLLKNHMNTQEDMIFVEAHIVGKPDVKISAITGSGGISQWNEFINAHMDDVLKNPGKILVYKPRNYSFFTFARLQPIIKDGETIGEYCLCLALTQNSTTRILKQNVSDTSNLALIFNADGEISNRTTSGFNVKNVKELNIHYEEASATGQCVNKLGTWVYDVQYIDAVDMYACVMTHMSAIDLTSRSFMTSIYIALGTLVLMAMIVATFMTQWINRPIQQLQRQFSEILNEPNHPPLQVTGSDELCSIADGINAVLEKQEMLIRDNYRNKILEKNARIELLQVQINPHFVFNTLDIINWFIYENRNKEAGRVLVALGEMMRYSTYRYKNFVTLGEEIKQIRNYCYIQLVRYDYSFQVNIDVEDGLNDFMIPCLIVQPLVENAVKYGAARKTSGGRIAVNVRRNENELIISVFDNGIGMTAEQIKKALSENTDADASEVCGIGLQNVNERMKLLFGAKYTISIESEIDYYTQVTLRLPFRGEANENYHR